MDRASLRRLCFKPQSLADSCSARDPDADRRRIQLHLVNGRAKTRL